jgi:peptidoglycan/xylan/chitin deacetylase (PgdA/CDA1 family)
MRQLKIRLLHVCKWLGLFAITRRWYADRLRILCYHGFELRDECDFRPQLFIRPRTFESRLAYLARRGIPVLPLPEALARMAAGTLPRGCTAITIDDGFQSTLTLAAPLLRKFQLPSMVYVTTYYVEKRSPVFRLALQYLFWQAKVDDAAARRLAAEMPVLDVAHDTADASQVMWAVIRHGETLDSEALRGALLLRVADLLGVGGDLDSQLAVFKLLAPDEVPQLADFGVDVQLHTHRHRFPPEDESAARREILDNRRSLGAMLGHAPNHFCYPSGVYQTFQWKLLEELGVASSTTCEPGLNNGATPRFGLKRFLDSEAISPIEFEAELAGFSEALRNFRALLRGKSSNPALPYD